MYGPTHRPTEPHGPELTPTFPYACDARHMVGSLWAQEGSAPPPAPWPPESPGAAPYTLGGGAANTLSGHLSPLSPYYQGPPNECGEPAEFCSARQNPHFPEVTTEIARVPAVPGAQGCGGVGCIRGLPSVRLGEPSGGTGNKATGGWGGGQTARRQTKGSLSVTRGRKGFARPGRTLQS